MLSLSRAELVDLTREFHDDPRKLKHDQLHAVDEFIRGNVLRVRGDLAGRMAENPGNARYRAVDAFLDFFLEGHNTIIHTLTT